MSWDTLTSWGPVLSSRSVSNFLRRQWCAKHSQEIQLLRLSQQTVFFFFFQCTWGLNSDFKALCLTDSPAFRVKDRQLLSKSHMAEIVGQETTKRNLYLFFSRQPNCLEADWRPEKCGKVLLATYWSFDIWQHLWRFKLLSEFQLHLLPNNKHCSQWVCPMFIVRNFIYLTVKNSLNQEVSSE